MPERHFSEEQRAEQSKRAKQMWAERRAKAQGYQQAPIIGVADDPKKLERMKEEARELVRTLRENGEAQRPVTGNKWEDLPYEEALGELGKLKTEYDRACDILRRRVESAPKLHRCFVAQHVKDMPDLPGIQSAYRKCIKNIPDGKGGVDNCVKDPLTGMYAPIHTCSSLCWTVYMTYRQTLVRASQEARWGRRG